MLFGPQLFMILALVAAIPATYGTMWVLRERAVKVAYENGKRVGAEQVAATTTAVSRERVAAVEEGERAAPVVPAERQMLIDLCNKSASCRSRKRQP